METNKNRRSLFSIFQTDISVLELRFPNFATIINLIWRSIRPFFYERPSQIIGSSFILLMIWGFHGNLEILKWILPGWRGPGIDLGKRPQLLSGIPWDHELISFWAGAFLLVVIPILIIKFGFRQPLANYGLGLPPKGKRKLALWTFLTLTLFCLPVFWMGSNNAEMRQVYPIFRPFSNLKEFVFYELTYLPLFIAIEFIFRGYLLFGLAGVRDEEIKDGAGGIKGEFYFGKYALLIQMLSYTAWHLGKPFPELWGTLVWGLAAGVSIYAVKSIWPVTLAHWLLNVFIDAVIVKPFS